MNSIRGDNLYKAYCATCHGSEAKGNGPMAAWLKVSGEEALPRGHDTSAMPVWRPVFSQVTRDKDLGRVRIDNLARYLRDIQGKQ